MSPGPPTDRVLTVPMFPLGSTLFPYQQMPLQVFEPRYRVLVEDCLAMVDDGVAPSFGVVLIERGSEVGGGDTRFDVGTLAHITDIRRFEDGRSVLMIRGATRLRVLEWLPDAPYPRATVSMLDEQTHADAADVSSTIPQVLDLIREVSQLRRRVLGMGDITPEDFDALLEDRWAEVGSDMASFVLAQMAGLGPLDAQKLLALDSSEERVAQLAALLAAECADLRTHVD